MRELRIHHLVDEMSDRCRGVPFPREELWVVRQVGREIDLVDLAGAFLGWAMDLDLSVDAAGPENGGIDEIGAIACNNDHGVVQRLEAIHLRAEHRDEGA